LFKDTKIKFIDNLCVIYAKLMLLIHHWNSYHARERWTR